MSIYSNLVCLIKLFYMHNFGGISHSPSENKLSEKIISRCLCDPNVTRTTLNKYSMHTAFRYSNFLWPCLPVWNKEGEQYMESSYHTGWRTLVAHWFSSPDKSGSINPAMKMES